MAIKDSKAYQTASRGYNTTVKSGGDIFKASKPYRTTGKSIIAAAKGNLFEFPVFISSSVQLDYATATSSLLEQVYASYVQTALSLNPIVDNSLVANNTPFAKFQSDTNRYVEYTEMDYAHEAVHNEFEMEDGSVLEFDMISIEDSDGKVILEYYDKRPLSEFDHYFQESVEDQYIQEADDRYIRQLEQDVKNLSQQVGDTKRNWKQIADARDRINEQKAKLKEREESLKVREASARAKAEIRKEADNLKAEKERLKKLEETLNTKEKEYQLDEREANETERHNKAMEKNQKATLDYNKKRDEKQDVTREAERKEDWDRELNFRYAVKQPELLDETKIKKLNTMKPLMMNASFNVRADNGQISQAINYVVAVKTFNRIIDADTLPEVVEYPLKEMNKIARKAKWRAGELKFFRDIIFKVKQKKQTAVDSRDSKRKWYRRLYELAHLTGDAPTKAVIKGKNVAWSVVKSQIEQDFDYGIIPNASLIISASDVSNVKAKTGIDLLKGSSAKKFCKELFLIALVVIDTDAESIKILMPDNHDDYEVHSLASVNKQLAELSTAGSKTRDIFKLLG